MAARMPKATIYVSLPMGSNGPRDTIMEFRHGNHETQLAKDIVDALRAIGYECSVRIHTEQDEVY